MERPRPLLVSGLTRSAARRGLERIEAEGLEGDVAPASAAGPTQRRSLRALAAGALAVLVGIGLFLATRMATRAPSSTDAREARTTQGSTRSVPETASPDTTAGSTLVTRALAGTVSVRCPSSVAAGFFVDVDLILTNAHALCQEQSTVEIRLSDGREALGVAVGSDEALDLALVKIEGLEAEPLVLGDAGSLQVGDEVTLVGSPVGLEFTVHRGLVSSLRRSVLGVAYIQLDAGINPGNSGGPLLDDEGHVVGVVSLKRADADGIGLALPINYAYDGAAPLLPGNGSAARSAGFEAMLNEAWRDEREALDSIASLDLAPALVGVRVDEYGRLVAGIVRPAHGVPSPETFSFRFQRQGETICALTSGVADWDVVEPRGQVDPRVAAWLERHGLGLTPFLGEAPLNWGLCSEIRAGTVLELEGADPQHARLTLPLGPRR
jgi:serine protease Do